MPSRSIRASIAVLLVLFLAAGLFASTAQAQTESERSESIILHTGDSLSVSSDRESLQLVEIKGNMSASRMPSPQHYPTNAFNFTSDAQGHYSVRLSFNYPSEYNVNILVYASSSAKEEKASYYVSSGQLALILDVEFKALDSAKALPSPSVWDSFRNWTTRFGDAFPLWVKLLYVLLGVQFVAVGYKWIKFESSARRESSQISRFDRGNLVYLWSEIFFKFLLTAFLVIAAAMGGQFILLSVLNFMFLAPVNMLSLWDLFVLGFAAGITAIAYVLKLCLEKSFDLKPLFQD